MLFFVRRPDDPQVVFSTPDASMRFTDKSLLRFENILFQQSVAATEPSIVLVDMRGTTEFVDCRFDMNDSTTAPIFRVYDNGEIDKNIDIIFKRCKFTGS